MPSTLHRHRLPAYLVAVLLVTAAVSVPTDAAGSADDGKAEFTRSTFVEQRGDVAEISVSFSGTDTASVRIGSDDSNYSATVVLTDEDGDGRATVLLNTYDLSYRAGDGDGLTVREETTAPGPLAVGTYDLAAWVGEGTAGTRSSVATLSVGERSTDAIETLVARNSFDLSDRAAIRASKASGNLTPSSTAIENGTLVLEIRASGLEGALAARNGSNATARFIKFFESEAASLSVRGLAPGTHQERAYLDVTDANATTVVADARNDTYYLVVDLQDVPVTDGHGGVPANNRNQYGTYRANLTLSAASPLADENESVVTDFGVQFRDAHVETSGRGGKLFLAPAPNQSVSGKTTLPPGARLTVRIYDEFGNVIATEMVRAENGTDSRLFAATFDLGGQENWTRITVTVAAADGPMLVGSRTGQEGMDGWIAVPNASVNLTDRGLDESGVLVEHASLSHGGYVAVHRGSVDGEVLARSEKLVPDEEFGQFLEFDAALDANVTLVAVAHRDGPGDSLGEPYTENGSIVADSVRYTTTPETTTPETTTQATSTVETTTPQTTETATSLDAATTTASPTPATTDGRTPDEVPISGFGVAPALVALLAGGLLARKR